MAHETERTSGTNFTVEETEKLLKLLKHPSIEKILAEVEKEESKK